MAELGDSLGENERVGERIVTGSRRYLTKSDAEPVVSTNGPGRVPVGREAATLGRSLMILRWYFVGQCYSSADTKLDNLQSSLRKHYHDDGDQ